MEVYADKTVFITGGSTGIGLAIAKAFAAMGSHVSIFARDLEKLNAAKEEIRLSAKSAQQKITAYKLDATMYEDVKTVFAEAIREHGAPYILINCVGIAQPGYFEDITFCSFEKTIHTNLYSTWNACSVIVPHMKLNGGYILNTSSIAGFTGVFGYTDYCMTKFGIIGFSEALRSELKRFNITVSVLCPPDTETPGYAAENATKPKETIAISGNAKLIQPEIVAETVLHQLHKKKLMIIVGAEGKFTWILKRFCPSLVEKFMDRVIKNYQKNK
jgi:short-subunit dehydrogenase